MKFATDRKRVGGLGSSGRGSDHHWHEMMTSMGLVVLVPVFLIVFAIGFGGGQADVLTYYSQPFPAIVTGLTIIVVTMHLMFEVNAAVEDYIHGTAGKLTLVAVKALSYALILVGLFAIARIAI